MIPSFWVYSSTPSNWCMLKVGCVWMRAARPLLATNFYIDTCMCVGCGRGGFYSMDMHGLPGILVALLSFVQLHRWK